MPKAKRPGHAQSFRYGRTQALRSQVVQHLKSLNTILGLARIDHYLNRANGEEFSNCYGYYRFEQQLRDQLGKHKKGDLALNLRKKFPQYFPFQIPANGQMASSQDLHINPHSNQVYNISNSQHINNQIMGESSDEEDRQWGACKCGYQVQYNALLERFQALEVKRQTDITILQQRILDLLEEQNRLELEKEEICREYQEDKKRIRDQLRKTENNERILKYQSYWHENGKFNPAESRDFEWRIKREKQLTKLEKEMGLLKEKLREQEEAQEDTAQQITTLTEQNKAKDKEISSHLHSQRNSDSSLKLAQDLFKQAQSLFLQHLQKCNQANATALAQSQSLELCFLSINQCLTAIPNKFDRILPYIQRLPESKQKQKILARIQ